MKIVLAIDGSPSSDLAVASIVKRPLNDDTEIYILNAYEKAYVAATMPGTIGTVTYYEDERHPAEKSAAKVTGDAAKKISEAHPSITIKEEQKEGAPKKVILDAAKNYGADLIILGSQGHGALESFLLGSVSMAIAHRAPCSVEIVR